MPPLVNDAASDHEDLDCSPSVCSSECDAAPSPSKKRIFFNTQIHVQHIAGLDDYTPQEVSACWYSKGEKALMWDSHEETVKRMEDGKRPKKNTSYRGLENWVKTNSSQLDQVVHRCIDAVMDEQDRQWKELPRGAIDWRLFREVSLKVSRASASLAYTMATHDESEAGKAYISMAKNEAKRQEKQGRRQSLGGETISSETTEVTNSTMVHEIRTKQKKKSLNPVRRLGRSSSSECTKKPKSKKTKRRSVKSSKGASAETKPRTKLALAA